MSDAAAFFANKKKNKKKAFKAFNANLVDASTVTSTVHVDAPALSTALDGEGGDGAVTAENGGASSANALSPSSSGQPQQSSDEQWDDVVQTPAPKVTTSATGDAAVGEVQAVQDIKSLSTTLSMQPSKGHSEADSIKEKLRIDATKAQLAAAREGMEREAAKLKEEKERQEAAKAKTAPRFGAAAAAVGGGGGSKWVAPHLRGGGGGGMGGRMRGMGGGSGPEKLDTNNEELFPDLAAADKILEEKEKSDQVRFKPPKKTPVGGGASWASKKTPAKPPMKRLEDEGTAPATKKESTTTPPPATAQADEKAPNKEPESKPATTPAAPAAAPVIKPKKSTGVKKKKKDLSSFKPKG